MPDTFAITILFIVISTVVGVFIKGRTKDPCLLDFSGYSIILEKSDGKIIWGKLCVENTALEFIYPEPYMDEKDKHLELSYVLYKNEYSQIKALIRYLDDMTPEFLKIREQDFKRLCKPVGYRRFGRRMRNFFGTIRDSFLELANLFMGRIKSSVPAGKILTGQDRYIAQMQQQGVAAAFNTSYEPVLERYIGKKVVLETMLGGKKSEYLGTLKKYTSEFVEIMDVIYKCPAGEASAGQKDAKSYKADLVIPRSLAIVRHAGK